ncbi:MAG: asparagine synthase (glutamine-hydrolyzing) [Mucilaginibacter sp.]|nr:asparagine synthase (glutamine-hydrolyzing) [Mucilaginibacter sp.]
MCRIAGLVNPQSTRNERVKVKAMCDALRHGGPDDEGIYASEDGSVIFGHRRLSIIDLSANGHQPMADSAAKVVISFNGEIYNYRELKHELKLLGSVFTNNTDTEVILQAYLQWNTAAFGKLRGMFAFALHDTLTGEVYLVRDSVGIKPLYYNIQGKQLAFASEVRAFTAGSVTTQNNANWPVYFLAYGHIPEPHTTLQNVYSLPKSHYLRWQKNGKHAVVKYQVDIKTAPVSNKDFAKEGIEYTLRKSIKRQLIADAPIGVFLSGGVDSSLVTLLADAEVDQLKTVSIFFNEKQYDERAYQQVILNKTSGENYTHLVQQQEFEKYFHNILQAMDMPTTDGINSWFISKYAREAGLKTVLSGLGGDELFGGYPSFDRIKYLGYLKKLGKSLSLFAMAGSERYKRLSYLAIDGLNADYLALRGFFSINEIAALTDANTGEIKKILFTDTPDNGMRYDKLKASRLEAGLYMQNQLLRDTDIMSMQHGLEVRVPFLDEDFIALPKVLNPT